MQPIHREQELECSPAAPSDLKFNRMVGAAVLGVLAALLFIDIERQDTAWFYPTLPIGAPATGYVKNGVWYSGMTGPTTLTVRVRGMQAPVYTLDSLAADRATALQAYLYLALGLGGAVTGLGLLGLHRWLNHSHTSHLTCCQLKRQNGSPVLGEGYAPPRQNK